MAAQFSRGWIFSRVTSMNRDDVVLPAELQAMSEADFAQFATRLAKLKQMKDG